MFQRGAFLVAWLIFRFTLYLSDFSKLIDLMLCRLMYSLGEKPVMRLKYRPKKL